MRDFIEDMFPRDVPFTSLYQSKTWDSFTGTQHTWDRVHVAMPNDAGDWETMDAGACAMNICDPQSRQIDWGVTRSTFGKMRRRWKTRILCLDQIRHVEEAAAQLEAIWKGLMKVPEYVNADWLKFMQFLGQVGNQTGSGGVCICGASDISSATPGSGLTLTNSSFTGGLQQVNLGSAANIPTSKLTMPYLMRKVPPLQYNGYFDGEFTPTGKFQLMTDLQTAYELCNGNPALTAMYDAADFEKGGKFFQYGAMMACGNFLIKIHPFMPRFQSRPDLGAGVIQRVWPFQNVPTTVGMMPLYDPAYENATIQASVIPHRLAREIYVGEIPSIHPRMQFGSRDLYGKWTWINDAFLRAFDPNTGAACDMENPVRNKGYFLADYEAGQRTVRPELECVILHLREPACMADSPRCAANPSTAYQSLLPYNAFCDTQGEEA
jgi:hypothetical protein